MVITTKALELQKDAVITWSWRGKDAHAGRGPVGNREFLSKRQEEGKKLDSVRTCLWIVGVSISLYGIRNYILKYKIDEEDGEYNSKSQMIVGLSLLTLWFVLGL